MTESYAFTAEDMAAMRREGSRGRFVRMLIGPPPGAARPAAAVSSRMPDDHIPGAWPTACGCSVCTGYAKDQPPAQDLLDAINQTADSESA